VRYIAEGLLVTQGVGWLFFEHPVLRLAMLLVVPLYLKWRMGEVQKKQAEEFASRMTEVLRSVAAHLRVGYSMENAWKEAYREAVRMYGGKNALCAELEKMLVRIEKNEPLEKVLAEFAGHSQNEDLKLFSDVVRYAKRNGGDFTSVMQTTIAQMAEKEAVDREIAVMMAEKRTELRIMCVVPAAILVYLRAVSAGYLSFLYETTAGIIVMSICLSAYGAAVYLGMRIVRIRV